MAQYAAGKPAPSCTSAAWLPSASKRDSSLERSERVSLISTALCNAGRTSPGPALPFLTICFSFAPSPSIWASLNGVKQPLLPSLPHSSDIMISVLSISSATCRVVRPKEFGIDGSPFASRSSLTILACPSSAAKLMQVDVHVTPLHCWFQSGTSARPEFTMMRTASVKASNMATLTASSCTPVGVTKKNRMSVRLSLTNASTTPAPVSPGFWQAICKAVKPICVFWFTSTLG
mmetsp:Transcript_34482/g.78693  ORF Transcript_34482/g.78693 Transcript_34482/m.78693 type:complete len:233 (+) Transcript_34482:1610-2308(+)